jgi:hypothetical protein
MFDYIDERWIRENGEDFRLHRKSESSRLFRAYLPTDKPGAEKQLICLAAESIVPGDCVEPLKSPGTKFEVSDVQPFASRKRTQFLVAFLLHKSPPKVISQVFHGPVGAVVTGDKNTTIVNQESTRENLGNGAKNQTARNASPDAGT